LGKKRQSKAWQKGEAEGRGQRAEGGGGEEGKRTEQAELPLEGGGDAVGILQVCQSQVHRLCIERGAPGTQKPLLNHEAPAHAAPRRVLVLECLLGPASTCQDELDDVEIACQAGLAERGGPSELGEGEVQRGEEDQPADDRKVGPAAGHVKGAAVVVVLGRGVGTAVQQEEVDHLCVALPAGVPEGGAPQGVCQARVQRRGGGEQQGADRPRVALGAGDAEGSETGVIFGVGIHLRVGEEGGEEGGGGPGGAGAVEWGGAFLVLGVGVHPGVGKEPEGDGEGF
jgi:hypothetical protein